MCFVQNWQWKTVMQMILCCTILSNQINWTGWLSGRWTTGIPHQKQRHIPQENNRIRKLLFILYSSSPLEAVPDLDFNMMLLYYNSTEGYCNVSVSCSAEDSYVSYTCDLYGCTEDQVVLLKPYLLMSVSGTDGTVACNASNLVSAKSRWGHMSDVCE